MPTKALMLALMTWVHGIVPGLPVPAEVPEVVVAQCFEGWCLRDEFAEYLDATPRHPNGVVHLGGDWKPGVLGYAVLAHELIHRMQDASHQKFACKEAQELDAWYVTRAYIETHQGDFWRLTEQSPRSLDKMTHCPTRRS